MGGDRWQESIGDTSLQAGTSCLVESARDLSQRTCAGAETSGQPLEIALRVLRSPRLTGGGASFVSGIHLHPGDGWLGGANEAVFPPTCQDSDGWLLGRRQVLAHGPLGRIENCTSLNVIVGHSDGWAPRERAWRLWGTVTRAPCRASPLGATGR